MPLLQVQNAVKSNAGGMVGAATSTTGELTGTGGCHLLQGPSPPATTQLTGAATDTGNTLLSGVEGMLQTAQLVPSPPATR